MIDILTTCRLCLFFPLFTQTIVASALLESISPMLVANSVNIGAFPLNLTALSRGQQTHQLKH